MLCKEVKNTIQEIKLNNLRQYCFTRDTNCFEDIILIDIMKLLCLFFYLIFTGILTFHNLNKFLEFIGTVIANYLKK